MDNKIMNKIDSIGTVITDVSQVIMKTDEVVTKFNKVAFEQIPNLGAKFEPTILALKKLAEKLEKPVSKTANELCKMVITSEKKDVVSDVIEKGKKFGGFLKRNANKTPQAACAINPCTVLMVVALASINKKMDTIAKAQNDIYDFLKLKEESELKGNVEFLHKVFDEYRYNWDNDRYKNSKCNAVQEIKRMSEGTIHEFRERIIREIGKKVNVLHGEKEIKSKIERLMQNFQDYELALYMYAFASFLDVMLIENYQEEYLKSVANSIENYVDKHNQLHEECCCQIEDMTKSSIQSRLTQGLAQFNKALGDGIAKIPKISDGQIDENLIARSEKNLEKNIHRVEKNMETLSSIGCDCIEPFINNVRTMSKLFNEGIDILFDNENMYFSI